MMGELKEDLKALAVCALWFALGYLVVSQVF